MQRFLLAASLLGAAGATQAVAALTLPDCPALQAWGAAHDPAADWPLNARQTLPDILAAERTQPLFGTPAIDWGKAGLRDVTKAIGACRKAAGKAKDKALAEEFAGLDKLLDGAARTLGDVERARAEVAEQLPALLQLPLDPQTLAALSALMQSDEEGLPKGSRLQGPAARPVQRIAGAFARLPSAEIAAVREAAAARYAEGSGALAEQYLATIAAAPESPEGILAVRTAALQAELDLGAEAAPVTAAAVEREAAIVAVLAPPDEEERAAHPIALPGCDALFTWAEAFGDERRRTPYGDLYADLAAAPFTALFGKPLADWSEADVTLGQAVAEQCLARAKSRVATPEMQTIARGSAGRLLAQFGRLLAQQRNIAASVTADDAAVAALEAALAAAPETLEGAEGVQALRQDPVLQKLDREERQRLEAMIDDRLLQIAAAVLQGPIAALGDITTDYEGLKRLVALRQETWNTYASRLTQAGMAPFEKALAPVLAGAAPAALPDYRAALDALPDTEEGYAAIDRLYLEATGDGRDAAFELFRQAALNRALRLQRVIATQRIQARCGELTAALELSDDEAAQPLLAGRHVTTLGDFLCGVTMAGNKVSAYESPGLLGSEHELAVVLSDSRFYRFYLVEAEVQPGQTALVAKGIDDGTSRRDITVDDWRMYADLIGSEDYASDWQCDQLLSQPLPDTREPQFDRTLFSCLLGRSVAAN